MKIEIEEDLITLLGGGPSTYDALGFRDDGLNASGRRPNPPSDEAMGFADAVCEMLAARISLQALVSSNTWRWNDAGVERETYYRSVEKLWELVRKSS